MSSKRDHSTRPDRAVRSSKHKSKTARPSARLSKAPRKGAKLPDLQPVLNAFLDGLGLVRCALAALRHSDNWGPEEIALRAGVEALQRVYSDIDGIETQLHRLRRQR